MNDLQGTLSAAEVAQREAEWDRAMPRDFEDGQPLYISKGQVWAPKFDYYHRHVVVDDAGDGKVVFHYRHDPAFRVYLTEAEFLSEYEYCPPEDA